jgi:hypothetical protein
MTRLSGIVADLKRRGVFRVAGIYAITAWALAEVAISIKEPLRLPDWLDTSVIVVLVSDFRLLLFSPTPSILHPRESNQTPVPAPIRTRLPWRLRRVWRFRRDLQPRQPHPI